MYSHELIVVLYGYIGPTLITVNWAVKMLSNTLIANNDH